MKTIHFWMDEFSKENVVRREVTVEHQDDSRTVARRKLWYEIESLAHVPPVETLNAFVCALIFEGMRTGRDLYAHGPVSRQLLVNLEEYQSVYSLWLPKSARRVSIHAEKELADIVTEADRPAMVAFSGGVDALFSYYRHTHSYGTRYPQNVGAIMLVHGFDLQLGAEKGFATARRTAEKVLKDEPVDHFWIRTNIREDAFIGKRKSRGADRWVLTFGAALASCFHQFERTHGYGIIGSDEPYHQLAMPWGSNPITNHLLSSDRLRINYDAGGYSRTDKVAALVNWPAAMKNLRVCYARKHGRNCCRCEKCIRTILNFRALGVPQPPSFPETVSNEQVRDVNLKNKVQRAYFVDIIRRAEANGIQDDWVEAAKGALRRSRKHAKAKLESGKQARSSPAGFRYSWYRYLRRLLGRS